MRPLHGTAAIRRTQHFVQGAVGEDPARTRRSSCLILLAIFVPIGVGSSLAFRTDDFGSPVSLAGLALAVALVGVVATTTTNERQRRWSWVVVMTAAAQALGIYQLGPYGVVLLAETVMTGVWAALYLPTRVVRLAVGSICVAITIALVRADDRALALVAVVVSQITVTVVSLLVHTTVLALRATNGDLDDARRLAHHLATTDSLTGTANRHSFTELVRALSGERALHTLLLVDVDHFKRLNDHYGHLIGDEVLRDIARRLVKAIPDASVARWGGEEFVVLCSNVDGSRAPTRAAEALRLSVAANPISTSVGLVSSTVSAGGTTWLTGESFEDALRRADDALYEAKARGRNRSVERIAG